MSDSLPPFTVEALQTCAQSLNPAAFYLPRNPDLVEHADLTLLIQGKQLPAHSQIMAARAPVFAPLMAHLPAGPLADPFGIDRLDAALLLLRLCYQPEAAAEGLHNCLGLVRELLPMLHRVNATHFLSGLDLAKAELQTKDLLGWLDASSQLPGMERLAADCAARLVNSAAKLAPHEQEEVHDRAFACLAMSALPLDQLCAPAQVLLCRAALAALSVARANDTRSSQRLAAGAAGMQQALQPVVRDLRGSDVLFASPAATQGTFRWDLGRLAADDLEENTVVSPSFSLCGREWRLRFTGFHPPLELAPEAEWGDPPARIMGLWLEPEDQDPEAVCVEVRLEHYSNSNLDFTRRVCTTLSRDRPVVTFQPFGDERDALVTAFNHNENCFTFKFVVQVAVVPQVVA